MTTCQDCGHQPFKASLIRRFRIMLCYAVETLSYSSFSCVINVFTHLSRRRCRTYCHRARHASPTTDTLTLGHKISMPVDTGTNTKSHLGALPPELLSKIFCYLADRPHVDVANLRLVCRSFVPLSSPFLITPAVVADRLDTLEKLQTLLRHPYFSKYVTHLVYDVSTYDATLAMNPEVFAHRTNNSFRTYHRHDLNSDVRRDRARISALLEDSHNPSQNLSPHSSQDADSVADSAHSSPEDDNSYWDGPRVIDQAREHALTQVRYCRRVIAQTALRERRVVSQYFCLAFDRFPHLRHLSFADFRSLSRNGESCDQLC